MPSPARIDDDHDDDIASAASSPLDLLLADAASSPLRRFLPGMSGVRFAGALARRPRTVAGRASGLAKELGRVVVGRSELAPHPKDRRFADDGWSKNPFLRRTLQGYLAAGTTARGLVADAGLGTINAVRLCVEVLADVAPVVVYANRFDERDVLHRRNLDWLRERCGYEVVTAVEEVTSRLARAGR